MSPSHSFARLAVLTPIILGLLVLAAWRGPARPCIRTDPLLVGPGVDLLKADGTLHLSLPANFFAAGSSPYSGDVACTGVPLKTAGAFELGTTTMVLERRSNVTLPLPSVSPVHDVVKVMEFGLNGLSPIGITVGGTIQNWTVSASLSASTPLLCSYDLTRASTTGGTFTASIEIPVLVMFTRNNQAKMLDLGSVTLTTSSGTWTTIDTSSTSGLAVSGMTLGVALTSNSLTSSALDLSISPAAVNPGRPGPAYVDPTATIDSAVGCLGRGCSIGANAMIDAGAVIGPHAVINTGAHIGVNAVIGDYATIGAGVTVGSGSVLGSHGSVGGGSGVGGDVIIGDDTSIGGGAGIGGGTHVGGGAVVQDNCEIGTSCSIGPGAQLGSGATVSTGISVEGGAIIGSNTSVTESIVLVYFEDGSSEYRSMPASSWPNGPLAAAVFGSLGLSGDSDGIPVLATVTQPDSSHPPGGGYGSLPGDIGHDVAAPHGGGTGHDYTEDGPYQCSWYAEQLRQQLDGLYTTTFTTIRRLNPSRHWWNRLWEPKWLPAGHAMTDIHWADGSVTWIEAQWTADHGAIDPKDPNHNLDGDGNHKVTYSDGVHSDEPTDGNVQIEVYASRAAAEAAWGGPFPGN
jgi:acyl-[acyl carrier protein]--UDP-N-acetylglucosamine O-acyltransferase